ncbi:MAG: beta-xylosidase, partial [Mycobacteriaceae bacterium]
MRRSALIACLITAVPLVDGALGAAPVSAAPSVTTVGVSAGYSIFGDSDAALARDLDTAKAAGVTWLRMDIDWSSIQGSGSGSFDWANTDRVVNAARARGMEVDGIVDYTPGWAS